MKKRSSKASFLCIPKFYHGDGSGRKIFAVITTVTTKVIVGSVRNKILIHFRSLVGNDTF